MCSVFTRLYGSSAEAAGPLEDPVRRAYIDPRDFDEMEFAQRLHVPPANVVKAGCAILLEMAVPGVREGEFTISLVKNVLTVMAGDPEAYTADSDRYLRREFVNGRFRRSFRLPPGMDTGEIDLSYEQGILTLRIPEGPHENADIVDVQFEHVV